MPTVPRRSTTGVVPTALPRVRINETAPIEAFGGGPGVDRAAGAVQRTLGVAGEIALEEKKKADEVLVRDLDLKLAQEETRIGVETKNMRGRAAAGAIDFVDTEWDKAFQNALSEAKNDDQRFALEKIAAARYASLNRTAQVHTDTALRQHDDEQAEVYMRTAQEQAALNYDNPDMVDRSLFIQEAEIEKFAHRNGKSPEWTALAKAQKRSQTHAKVLERMLVDGQDDLAKAYEKDHSKEILDDERATLARVRKDTAAMRAAEKDALERDLYLRTISRNIGLPEATALLAAGQIDIPFYEKLRGRILNVNDDPSIPTTDKTKRLFELLDRFGQLNGAGVDLEAQKIDAVASGNRLTELQSFRSLVAESAPYLTEAQEQAFYRYTQKDLDDAMAGKVGMFRNLMRMMSDAFSRAPSAVAPIAGPLMQKAMAIFDPSVTPAKAMETTQVLREQAIVATNPRRSQYQIGQVVTNPSGMRAEVTGFDERGNPVLKVIK